MIRTEIDAAVASMRGCQVSMHEQRARCCRDSLSLGPMMRLC